MPIASGAPQGMTYAQKQVDFWVKTATGELAAEQVRTLEYRVSDAIQEQDDAEYSSISASYVKLVELTLTIPLTRARIKFDIKSSNAVIDAYGKIYKNGVAIGTEQTRTGTIYETKSEDFATLNAGIGDTIELWGHCNGSDSVFVCNFRICYSIHL